MKVGEMLIEIAKHGRIKIDLDVNRDTGERRVLFVFDGAQTYARAIVFDNCPDASAGLMLESAILACYKHRQEWGRR